MSCGVVRVGTGGEFDEFFPALPERELMKDQNAVRRDPAGIMTETRRRFKLDTRRLFRFALPDFVSHRHA